MPRPTSLTLIRRGVPDALLGLAVAVAVGLMLIPVPTWLLDVLWAAQLAGAIGLLSLALFTSSALGVTTFPSVLLLGTLFRLSLGVASARLLLAHADAGSVVRAFGAIAVQGNPIVGLVVLVMLLVIELVVITKGAERIAEVGARFALDSQPGKQLGIDAQQRIGALSTGEARRARERLDAESQFYGSMDGAMKFVKGDVVAGAVIVSVTLVAGMALGVLSGGMRLGDAFRTYGTLAVGLGFVSQIPALVVALASGLLVTRASASTRSASLGAQLFAELSIAPSALFGTAVVMGLFAALPGLPALPFALVALGSCALALAARRQRPLTDVWSAAPRDQRTLASHVPLWEVRVGRDLEGWLGRTSLVAGPEPSLWQLTEQIRAAYFERLGLPLAACAFDVEPTWEGARVQVWVRGVPELDVTAPTGPGRAEWFKGRVLKVLELRAADLLGSAETAELLDRLRERAPALVEQATSDKRGLVRLTQVLRQLVAEGVSVRDLALVLDTLSQRGAEEGTPALVEVCRRALRRSVCHELSAGTGELGVVTLSPELEDTLRESLVSTPDGVSALLAPSARADLIRAVERALGDAPARPVILVSPDVRPHLWRLLSGEIPHVRVVCAEELTPETRVRRVAEANPFSLA